MARFAEQLPRAYIERMRKDVEKELPFLSIQSKWKDTDFWTRIRIMEMTQAKTIPLTTSSKVLTNGSHSKSGVPYVYDRPE